MRKRLICIMTLMLMCLGMSAQTDFGAWEMLKFNKRIGDRFTTLLSLEHRSKNNARDLDIAIIIPGVSYKATSWLTVGLMYNHVMTSDGSRENILPLVTFSKSLGNLSLSLREMGQYTLNNNSFLMRNKATAKYRIAGSAIAPRVELETYIKPDTVVKGDYGNPFVNAAVSTNTIRAKNIIGADIAASSRLSVMVNYIYYYLGATAPGRHVVQTGLTVNL